MTNYDFDTDGQPIINGVTVDHSEFAEMLEKYMDGFCATNCGETINLGEIICNDCFDKAKSYRVDGPPLPHTYND